MPMREIPSIPYRCPGCGAAVGVLVPDGDAVRLDAGGWLMADSKQHCHRCGRLVHFRSPRETWSEMVVRLTRRTDVHSPA